MNKKLKTARENAGFTQVQVANKAKISERQYIRIEKGERDPRTATSIHIAKAVGSTVEELFGSTNPIDKTPDGNRAQ